MAQLTLRTPDDVRRLFSALGQVPMEHESGGLSLAEYEHQALSGEMDVDMSGMLLSVLVAASAAWVAIQGTQRNQSIPWGIGWGVLGYLFPIPAAGYTAYTLYAPR